MGLDSGGGDDNNGNNKINAHISIIPYTNNFRGSKCNYTHSMTVQTTAQRR